MAVKKIETPGVTGSNSDLAQEQVNNLQNKLVNLDDYITANQKVIDDANAKDEDKEIAKLKVEELTAFKAQLNSILQDANKSLENIKALDQLKASYASKTDLEAININTPQIKDISNDTVKLTEEGYIVNSRIKKTKG